VNDTITLNKADFEQLLSFVNATLAVRERCDYLLSTTPPMPEDENERARMQWMTLGAKAAAETIAGILRSSLEASAEVSYEEVSA
jgi:hypothetical protein